LSVFHLLQKTTLVVLFSKAPNRGLLFASELCQGQYYISLYVYFSSTLQTLSITN